ncbi:TPA: hypothetical protein ACH3X3_014068 [Trebouxia sp. C0006]
MPALAGAQPEGTRAEVGADKIMTPAPLSMTPSGSQAAAAPPPTALAAAITAVNSAPAMDPLLGKDEDQLQQKPQQPHW